jgi:hypothetical protein
MRGARRKWRTDLEVPKVPKVRDNKPVMVVQRARVLTRKEMGRAMRSAMTEQDVRDLYCAMLGIAASADERTKDRIAAAKLVLAYAMGSPDAPDTLDLGTATDVPETGVNEVSAGPADKKRLVLRALHTDAIFKDPEFLQQMRDHLDEIAGATGAVPTSDGSLPDDQSDNPTPDGP